MIIDTLHAGNLKGVGQVHLQAVVDTFGSCAFEFLHMGKLPERAAAVINNDVLPLFQDRDLTVGSILTDNGRQYSGTEGHRYEIYLAVSDIEQRQTQVSHLRTNGLVGRFNRTVLDEFLRKASLER